MQLLESLTFIKKNGNCDQSSGNVTYIVGGTGSKVYDIKVQLLLLLSHTVTSNGGTPLILSIWK